jgi:hypothetical protein
VPTGRRRARPGAAAKDGASYRVDLNRWAPAPTSRSTSLWTQCLCSHARESAPRCWCAGPAPDRAPAPSTGTPRASGSTPTAGPPHQHREAPDVLSRSANPRENAAAARPSHPQQPGPGPRCQGSCRAGPPRPGRGWCRGQRRGWCQGREPRTATSRRPIPRRPSPREPSTRALTQKAFLPGTSAIIRPHGAGRAAP